VPWWPLLICGFTLLTLSDNTAVWAALNRFLSPKRCSPLQGLQVTKKQTSILWQTQQLQAEQLRQQQTTPKGLLPLESTGQSTAL
jgi:hypothetical protein